MKEEYCNDNLNLGTNEITSSLSTIALRTTACLTG